MKHSASALLLIALLSPASLASPATTADETTRYLRVQDGRQLEVLISNQFKPAMRDNLMQWVDYIAAALGGVYGHWPTRHWQISIAPTAASSSEPIPWAQVRREDITRVEFFTAAFASADELQRAWTSYHELAHLLIPYQGSGDAWFSEGLASYYQNILQARAGLISEREMWQRLYNGFQRGLAETQFDGQALQAVSDRLREDGGFMRVYWSGAWYFLAADTRLRLQSGGKLSLDKALERLNQCCAEERLPVPEIVARLDQLNRVVLFSILYDEVANSTAVPPFAAIFASLGIDIEDGQIRLQETGPGARLRRGIVAVPAPAL
ncbi:MAG: hypothetical protein OEW92_03425 [Gammaproteobacteria bacterium]|nr:hypothetical protein [Gammaproteobacteria bacterium]MDH5171443.1 hypothetical protein [Gammaproteobacteria bacterium]